MSAKTQSNGFRVRHVSASPKALVPFRLQLEVLKARGNGVVTTIDSVRFTPHPQAVYQAFADRFPAMPRLPT